MDGRSISVFGPSIKVKKELWERIKRCAESAGYSSPDEFVQHLLEREVARVEDTQSDEEIARKLKGLGYLDEAILRSAGDSHCESSHSRTFLRTPAVC